MRIGVVISQQRRLREFGRFPVCRGGHARTASHPGEGQGDDDVLQSESGGAGHFGSGRPRGVFGKLGKGVFGLRDGRIGLRCAAMNRSRRLPLLTGILCLTASCALAQETPLSRMPDRSKAERLGYVVEVEGGEDGPKSVYIPAKPRREPSQLRDAAFSAAPVQAESRGGVSTPAAPGAVASPAPAASTEPKRSFWSRLFSSREETPDVDHALNKTSKMEENLSGRRYDGKKSDVLENRYERKDAVGFDMWERRFDSYGRKRSESVDTASRFDAEHVDKATVSYDRMDFDAFERRSDKAEIKNWNERTSRSMASKYADPDSRSSFRDRMATGYNLMSQVSMQDINRYQYRRNRSDEKGALPVAKPGSEARPANASQ